MKPVIITIGRQFGSGGHELGEKLAKRLGIPFYDRQLLSEAAERSGLTKEMIESLDEKPTSSFLYSLAMGGGYGAANMQLPLGNQVFLAMSEVIRDVAAKGSCVIVGRCAEYVLADNPDLIRIFVHADKQAKIDRICRVKNLKEKDAAVLMQRTDKKRASYHDFYAEEKWGVAASYDLTVNSATFGIDGAVEMLAAFVENR